MIPLNQNFLRLGPVHNYVMSIKINVMSNKKWGSPCSFLCNLDGYYGKYMTLKVYIRNPSNPKRELSSLEKIISCIKISKQLYKIDFNLT